MFKFLLCILSAVLVAECKLVPHIAARADLSLSNFLLSQQGRALSPSSSQCFSSYLALLAAAADRWSQEHEACVKAAEDSMIAVNDLASAHSKNVSTQAGSIVSYIGYCDSESDPLLSLGCYKNLTTDNLYKIYDISNNAADALVSLNAKIYIIDSDSYSCSNASERNYFETCAEIYDAMNYCFQNGPPPTVPPPTTSTTTLDPVLPSDEIRDILLPAVAAAPRRTPALFAVKSQEKENENKPVPRSGSHISKLTAWLEQQGNQDAVKV
uniref:Protein TsetseEP domain-containing protein n=1 Tax=Ceratitis capitata TaxID=7213 RepID=W8C738_CERCA